MKKQRRDDSFIKQPYYLGGAKAMEAFISQHLVYPPSALEKKLSGTVHIRYNINHQGDVTEAKVIGHGVDAECNAEAIRVVKMLHFEIPKTPRKLKVTYHKTINILYDAVKKIAYMEALEKKKKEAQPPTIESTVAYTLVPTPKSVAPTPPAPPKPVLTYTIKIGN